MNEEKDNAFKRIAFAAVGAVAKGVESVDEFISGKGRECMDELVEKGRSVFYDGMQAGSDLQRKAQEKFDEFCRKEKQDVDLESMTQEEREALLEKLLKMEQERNAAPSDAAPEAEAPDAAEQGE